MLVFLRQFFTSTKLRVWFIVIALAITFAVEQAKAMKVDPVWAAKQAALQRAAAHPLANMSRDIHPLALNKPGTVEAATPFAATVTFEKIRGIRVTPTSASWKINGLKPELVKLLVRVQLHFGEPLDIISGCRNKAHNKRVGGAKRSQHLKCAAADFKVPGVSKTKLAAYLKQMPGRGGVGLYCASSYIHLDIGPKRQWHWKCGKRKKYKKRRASRKVAKLNKKRRVRRKATKLNKKRRSRRVVRKAVRKPAAKKFRVSRNDQ